MQTYEPIRTIFKPSRARNLKRGSFISVHYFFFFEVSICDQLGMWKGNISWQKCVAERETAASYARRQRKELEYHNPFGRHNHSDLRPHPIVPNNVMVGTSPLSPSLYRTLSVQIVAGPMPGCTFIPSVTVFFLAMGGLLREA